MAEGGTRMAIQVNDIVVKFFDFMDKFNMKAAGDLAKSKQGIGPPWSSIIQPLLMISNCEKIYYSLTYLGLKKDHLATMYASTLDDLSKGLASFEALARNQGLPKSHREESESFADMIQELSVIPTVRHQLISIYRVLATFKQRPNYKELILTLEKLEQSVATLLTLKSLGPIKFHLQAELYILHKLLLSQVSMAQHQYKDTIFNMYQARMEIDQWRQRFEGKEFKSDPNKPSKTPLVLWMTQFHSALSAKMSFYFYSILLKQERELGADIKATMNKLEWNYPAILENFCQRAQCKHAMLIFEAEELRPSELDLAGYVCRAEIEEDNDEPVTGIRSWPAIYSCPKIDETPLTHWPNIISLIQDNKGELLKYGYEPLHWYDDQVNASYFIMKLEHRVNLTLIFNDKKRKNDPQIVDFMASLALNLRNVKAFERLTPKT